ncbi:pirin family protein [Puteibacter caeruleilacunae]|nr:pirin family protein [Puteibacter caeruleilacunae]
MLKCINLKQDCMLRVKRVIRAVKVNMGGNLLNQALPNKHIKYVDPFVLIHHWSDRLPGKQHQQELGVGPHPHRGFSPITLILEGSVHHRDSIGNDHIVKAGGVQWMNAGRGIIHSERPSKELARSGGNYNILQFWLNSPAKSKMNTPVYHALQKEEIPKSNSNNKVVVDIISGQHKGIKGPFSSYTSTKVLIIEMKTGSSEHIHIPEGFNTLLYHLEGRFTINNFSHSREKDLVWFEKSRDRKIILTATEDSKAVLLSGEPINEPIVTYGPFVMNNRTEIMQTLKDSNSGKFGSLLENFSL